MSISQDLELECSICNGDMYLDTWNNRFENHWVCKKCGHTIPDSILNSKKLTEVQLPWRCSEHPNAKILESWDETHYVMNGYPVGQGLKVNYKFECCICGQEVRPSKKKVV